MGYFFLLIIANCCLRLHKKAVKKKIAYLRIFKGRSAFDQNNGHHSKGYILKGGLYSEYDDTNWD